MNNEELAQIIRREARFINFLIVMTNVFMFIQLRNMTVKMNETNTGIFLSIFFSAAFTVVSLVKKPLEVVDLRPSKNVDLK
jgi:ABC-type Mn2+/Zn2+ transport system permease subunit